MKIKIMESMLIIWAWLGVKVHKAEDIPNGLILRISTPNKSYKKNDFGEELSGRNLASCLRQSLIGFGFENISMSFKPRDEEWTQDKATEAAEKMKQLLYAILVWRIIMRAIRMTRDYNPDYMNIDLDVFFPCSQRKFNQFISYVNGYYDKFSDGNIHMDILDFYDYLKPYFQERISIIPDEVESAKKNVAEYKSQITYLKKKIQEEKKSAKAKGIEPQLKELQEEYQTCNDNYKLAQEKVKEILNSVKTFEKYLQKLDKIGGTK